MSGIFHSAVRPDETSMIFIDGENLVFRYQDMLEKGAMPLGNVKLQHVKDVCVWTEFLGYRLLTSPLSINYYASSTGSDEHINKIRDYIRGYFVQSTWAKIKAVVFKKEAQKRKSKLVDMSICIDALRHTYQDDIDVVTLVSGDGDYLPLIREIQRRGKRVQVMALSSGLEPELRRSADHFTDLDEHFFVPGG